MWGEIEEQFGVLGPHGVLQLCFLGLVSVDFRYG